MIQEYSVFLKTNYHRLINTDAERFIASEKKNVLELTLYQMGEIVEQAFTTFQ